MKNINIAELLKDCPKGMELYSPIFGEVYFKRIKNIGRATLIEVATSCNSIYQFYPDGKYNTYYSDSECLLFPSKDQRDWSKFQRPFKDGDIVANDTGWIGITSGGKIYSFIPTYCVIKPNGEFEAYFDKKGTWQFSRLATEEEKQKLFDAIKAHGYKWNAETKTLERSIVPIVPKFKVGDRLRSTIVNLGNIYTVLKVEASRYIVKKNNENDYSPIDFDEENNYELAPNKFDITTLKPFDKVLTRIKKGAVWCNDFFGYYKDGWFYCSGHIAVLQCIPYEGNEHLLGTTDDCDDFYKTWK